MNGLFTSPKYLMTRPIPPSLKKEEYIYNLPQSQRPGSNTFDVLPHVPSTTPLLFVAVYFLFYIYHRLLNFLFLVILTRTKACITHSSTILTRTKACITHSSAILTRTKACTTHSSAILTRTKACITHSSAILT